MVNNIFQSVAVFATVLICFMVVYQFLLAVGGFFHYRRSLREKQIPLPAPEDFPELTILIPAHNEELVIERTIATLLALQYPEDRLKLLVINDASTDATGEILDRLSLENPRVKVFHRGKPEGGCGKAAALNAAMRLVTSEYVAIYDADNCPEPEALRYLMARFLLKPHLAAVVGKFRTGNKRKNILTRFINIEGLCFQSVIQAGRHFWMGVAFLTGTNYIIRRSVLVDIGGWDEEALAEDSEMSTRLYMNGYRVDYIPYSISWEQEPETFPVWLKQRTRWARGNNYAIVKLIRTFRHSHSKLMSFENVFMLSTSYLFLFAIIISQVVTLLSYCKMGYLFVQADWLLYFWAAAFILYLFELSLVLSFDNERSNENILVGMVMYLIYCYMWALAILKALYYDCIVRSKRTWDKTVRFNTELETGQTAVIGAGE